MEMSVEIRRGTDRFVDRERGRVTHHAFSFGPHHDPERLGFGPMVCHDDHLVGRGLGFDPHRHSGLEIVTWVVEGALEHSDAGHGRSVVGPGSVAHLSAGAGVEHSEHATPDGPCRFVQVWLRGASDTTPAYDVRPVALDHGRLVPALTVGDATLAVARLDAGDVLALPDAPRVHAFVATGALLRFSLAEPLAAGDAMLLTDEPSYDVTAAVPTDLLVWAFLE